MDQTEDNLYPTSSAYMPLVKNREDVLEESKEKASVQKSLPVIKDVIKRLQERIAFYNCIDSIDSTAMTNPDEFMHIVAAHKIVRSNLEMEKQALEELVETHIKR